ncbi:MAG: DUF2007 domain-containing protein [Solirubrobacterales bacterium]|nr:DUF2007 domain-containing protein [Solirubrobacterales bacterium]
MPDLRQPIPAPLVCPGCGDRAAPSERFCDACGLPLVVSPERLAVTPPVSDRHRWARQIKPQLAEGELVKVARAANQTEAEFIQGLLLEEGVPSLLRRSAGFDVPDMLAAGPRDVMVPESGAATAREVLLEAEVVDDAAPPRAATPPARLLAGLVAALAVGALVIWLAWLLMQ